MTYKDCYVTGNKNTLPYDLGDKIYVGLTQEASAYFIIRATKDVHHQNIIAQLENLQKDSNKILDATYDSALTGKVDSYSFVKTQMEAYKNDVEFTRLMYEKAVSAVRILDEMRKQYQETKKLSAE